MNERDPSQEPVLPDAEASSSPAAGDSPSVQFAPARESLKPLLKSRVVPQEREADSSSPPIRRARRPLPHWLRWVAVPAAAAIVAALLIGAMVWSHYRSEAEKYDLSGLPRLSQGTRVLDRQGEFVGTVFAGDRKFITIGEAPGHLLDALVATEDSRYYKHNGVDLKGIIRAFSANAKSLSIRQGGSTITQQLARQAFELKGRTLQRKLLETFIAMRLERQFSKAQIMEYYLNHIYLGSGFYGIGSAARGYFGKDVADLNPEESAMLVAIIKAPVTLSPYRSPEAARKVRNLTLDRMQKLGYVSDTAAASLKAKPLGVMPEDRRRERPNYLIAALERELESAARPSAHDSIRVTVDAKLQKAAAAILQNHLERVEKRFGQAADASQPLQGAVLVLDNETGAVLATIGGRDYRTSPFDRALQAQRPAGAAFLPAAYAAMLSIKPEVSGWWVLDAPLDNRRAMVGAMEGILGEWGNEAAPRVYEGHISSAYALLRGKTGATVRLGYEAGLEPARVKLQHCFGTPLREQAAVLLGSSAVRMVDVARAFAAIANDGRLPPSPRLAVAIQKPDGTESSVPLQDSTIQAFTPGAANWVRGVMVANLNQQAYEPVLREAGLSSRGISGYGGTAYGFTDAWFTGSDRKVTCVVWLGYDDNRPIGDDAWARETALPLWVELMAAATQGQAAGWPVQPATAVCVRSGSKAGPACNQENDPLLMPTTGEVANLAPPRCLYHPLDGSPPGAPAAVAEVFDGRQAAEKPPAARPVVRSVKAMQPAVVGPDVFGSAPKSQSD